MHDNDYDYGMGTGMDKRNDTKRYHDCWPKLKKK